MKRYILKQLLLMIPAVLAVTIVAFALIRLMPSDAVNTYLLANHLERNEENIAIAEKRFGLDEPAPKQYLHWMQNVLRLDFGESYLNRQDVASMLKNAFLATLRLALASMVWILVLTPLLGIGAAAKPGGLTDKFTRFYCLCGTAIPTFVLGFLLIRLFAVRWRILPAISDGTLKSYLLPSFTLSLSHIAYFVQMLRNEMLENRSGAFVLYARARGIGEKRIFRTHLLKNSMQPVVNTVGISIGRLIAGTVVVENVFSWPGLGLLITKAILSRDYPVIQGYILIIALIYILANFISDLLSTLVDPRIRLGKGESA